jgi:hypothetical protein
VAVAMAAAVAVRRLVARRAAAAERPAEDTTPPPSPGMQVRVEPVGGEPCADRRVRARVCERELRTA